MSVGSSSRGVPGAPMPNVAVSGLFETHVTVARLEPSIAFYRDVVGLEVAAIFEERRVAFFWIGGRGNSMLGRVGGRHRAQRHAAAPRLHLRGR